MDQRAGRGDRIALVEVLSPVSLLLPPVVVTAAMWATSPNPVGLTAAGCAYAMLQWAWGAYLVWKRRNGGSLPVFAMMAAIYWIYFALPLFWGERTILAGRFLLLDEDYITQTMLMAFVGVTCLWVGMELPLRASTQYMPDIDERASSSWAYLRIVLVITSLIGLYGPSIYWLGAEGRHVMVKLTTTVPAVAFLLLLRRCWMRTASPVDRPLLLVVAATRALGFLASGWLGPTVGLGLTVVGLFIVVHRRIPWTPILVTIASILFLQVGKDTFRAVYWGADADERAGVVERAQFWLDASASRWSDALLNAGGGEASSSELASRSMNRVSLLGQVAHVLELTPAQVPFQGGQTYSFLAVTLIPRFVWPDKPSVNEANRFYQVAYGLTDVRNLDKTSLAVGSLAEGYINFGWLGVIMVMLGIGAILRIYEGLCSSNQSNTLLLAVGISLLPEFLTIDSQLGQYIGGMIQGTVLTVAVFLPITRLKSRKAISSKGIEVPLVRARTYRADSVL